MSNCLLQETNENIYMKLKSVSLFNITDVRIILCTNLCLLRFVMVFIYVNKRNNINDVHIVDKFLNFQYRLYSPLKVVVPGELNVEITVIFVILTFEINNSCSVLKEERHCADIF